MEYPKTTGESFSKTITSGYMKMGAQQGWQCPVCGNVNSPWTMQCPCHGNPIWNTITTTGTTEQTIDLSKGSHTHDPYNEFTETYCDMSDKNCGQDEIEKDKK